MNKVTLALAAWGLLLCASGCTETKPAEVSAYDGGTMTWHRDVLPIAQRRCQGCHLEGGIAPFPLTSFSAAADRHRLIAGVVKDRIMPPWMPAEGPHEIQGSRRLTLTELDVIQAWSAQGAQQGDPADAPPAADPRPTLAWTDQVIEPATPYMPLQDVTDDYHCFVLDPGLDGTKELVGFSVEPGVPHQVHHMLLFAVPRQAALAKDAKDERSGWTCFGGPGVQADLLGVWAPGTPPTRYPEGTGVRVNADSVYVMQVHYNLHHGTPEPDQTRVALQYAREPVKKLASLYPVIDAAFAIPPRARGYSHGISQYVPGGTLWGLMPHMHTRGKRIQVSLGGDSLIDIPAWNFHWQQNYFYVNPVPVPLYTQVKLTCTWDNPSARTVTWGDGTEDEMCLAYLYLTN